MFETGVRQLRMALSMLRGARISPENIERLIHDARATLRMFGAPGRDVEQLVDGPYSDPELRRQLQNTSVRRTVRRTANVSPYYRNLLRERGIDPATISTGSISQLPLTCKADLMRQPGDFLADGSEPVLSTRSTGTTGRPVMIWMSRYEVELWPALAALAGLLRGEILEGDSMQVNISSRATAAVQQNVSVCRLAGAACHVLGLIPPVESVRNLLAEPFAPTLLTTYPSYLEEMVEAARTLELGPPDFRLRRIDCGGEVLTPALAAEALEVFGAPVNDTFGMTEVLPVSGRTCSEGHLHHDLNMGYVEVVDLDTGAPVEPGELGTVVVTPYYPYRECMPVLRYDTRDMVRRLPDDGRTCELAGMPATSGILGKADLFAKGLDELVLPLEMVALRDRLTSAGIEVRVDAGGDLAFRPRSRADLREVTFTEEPS